MHKPSNNYITVQHFIQAVVQKKKLCWTPGNCDIKGNEISTPSVSKNPIISPLTYVLQWSLKVT